MTVPVTSTVALLVNPAAGRGRGVAVAGQVAGRLRAAGVGVEVLLGADADEAVALARAAASVVDAVIALGGDGAVHLATQAVAGTSTRLGVVPVGTGNDVAATLGLPRGDPLAAADLVVRELAGPGRAIDAVRVEPAAGPAPAGSLPRWYLGVLGAGFDSRVTERANRIGWPRGRLRYDVAMLVELGVFRPVPFQLDVDGVHWETPAMLVAVGNTVSYGGGMRVCPRARVDDGLLDVTLVTPISTAGFLRVFPRVYRGDHLDHPAVRTARGRVVTLHAPGITAYADGERLGPLPLRLRCVPGAVRVLAPGPAGRST